MKSNNRKWTLTNFCELDKFAIKSYCAIHDVDESLNLGDITTVDENSLREFSMICGGSPCQDFSIAGKQAGSMWKCNQCNESYNPLTVHFDKRDQCPKCGSRDINKTRSSLLVEWLRILRANKPKWAIYENVKNIVGKKFKATFEMFLRELMEYGYNVYYDVLNAKDYGIPQNRERLYLLAIRNDLDNGKFKFPEPINSDIALKDILEDEVDEKYYVNTPGATALIDKLVAEGKISDNTADSDRAGGEQISHLSGSISRVLLTGLFSNQCTQFDKETIYANTILARDYKGFGNQGMNGVIEYAPH